MASIAGIAIGSTALGISIAAQSTAGVALNEANKNKVKNTEADVPNGQDLLNTSGKLKKIVGFGITSDEDTVWFPNSIQNVNTTQGTRILNDNNQLKLLFGEGITSTEETITINSGGYPVTNAPGSQGVEILNNKNQLKRIVGGGVTQTTDQINLPDKITNAASSEFPLLLNNTIKQLAGAGITADTTTITIPVPGNTTDVNGIEMVDSKGKTLKVQAKGVGKSATLFSFPTQNSFDAVVGGAIQGDIYNYTFTSIVSALVAIPGGVKTIAVVGNITEPLDVKIPDNMHLYLYVPENITVTMNGAFTGGSNSALTVFGKGTIDISPTATHLVNVMTSLELNDIKITQGNSRSISNTTNVVIKNCIISSTVVPFTIDNSQDVEISSTTISVTAFLIDKIVSLKLHDSTINNNVDIQTGTSAPAVVMNNLNISNVDAGNITIGNNTTTTTSTTCEVYIFNVKALSFHLSMINVNPKNIESLNIAGSTVIDIGSGCKNITNCFFGSSFSYYTNVINTFTIISSCHIVGVAQFTANNNNNMDNFYISQTIFDQTLTFSHIVKNCYFSNVKCTNIAFSQLWRTCFTACSFDNFNADYTEDCRFVSNYILTSMTFKNLILSTIFIVNKFTRRRLPGDPAGSPLVCTMNFEGVVENLVFNNNVTTYKNSLNINVNNVNITSSQFNNNYLGGGNLIIAGGENTNATNVQIKNNFMNYLDFRGSDSGTLLHGISNIYVTGNTFRGSRNHSTYFQQVSCYVGSLNGESVNCVISDNDCLSDILLQTPDINKNIVNINRCRLIGNRCSNLYVNDQALVDTKHISNTVIQGNNVSGDINIILGPNPAATASVFQAVMFQNNSIVGNTVLGNITINATAPNVARRNILVGNVAEKGYGSGWRDAENPYGVNI